MNSSELNVFTDGEVNDLDIREIFKPSTLRDRSYHEVINDKDHHIRHHGYQTCPSKYGYKNNYNNPNFNKTNNSRSR